MRRELVVRDDENFPQALDGSEVIDDVLEHGLAADGEERLGLVEVRG